MTNRQSDNPELIIRVLDHLGVERKLPDRLLLEKLVSAFVRTVPWESAFRIVRRAHCGDLESCPRWPQEFWLEHLNGGAGGSCFETNYAFYYLLESLGYQCYLTINDMQDSVGCHTAIVVIFNDRKWLVDVGFPLYTILPLNPNGHTFRHSPFLGYTVRLEGRNRYQIERRPHPKWYAFTLLDEPVSEEQYRWATTADYGTQGHFLDRVIIHKVMNEQLWRFNSGEHPYCLEFFEYGKRGNQLLEGDVAKTIAQKFGMDEDILRKALTLVESQIGENGPNR